MPAGDKVDQPVENPSPDDATAPVDDGKITIPLDQPEMADMFKDCQPGETLTVDSKDENTIVCSPRRVTEVAENRTRLETPGAPTPPEAEMTIRRLPRSLPAR